MANLQTQRPRWFQLSIYTNYHPGPWRVLTRFGDRRSNAADVKGRRMNEYRWYYTNTLATPPYRRETTRALLCLTPRARPRAHGGPST